MARRKREQREWDAAHAETIADAGLFAREILPAIQPLPLSDLVRATGLTHGYLSKIRRGEKVPHPRHWAAFRNVREVTLVRDSSGDGSRTTVESPRGAIPRPWIVGTR
jgi:hypothetical protein